MAFREDAIKERTVQNWFQTFASDNGSLKNGHPDLEDHFP